MPKKILISAMVIASLSLSGCSVFYPNWGATSLPVESMATQVPQDSPEATPTDTAAPQESQTPSAEPTETPTETVAPQKQTSVEIIMAMVDAEAGYLTVVAQLPEIVESGGECTFKFIGGSVTKTLTVPAEPSSDYTQCHPIEVELKDLAKGNGVVTVSYSSDLYMGTSAGNSVVIP